MAERRAEARRLVAPARNTPAPARPRFSQPVRQVVMMLVVLALVGSGGALIFGRIRDVFATSPWVNGTIGAVFVLGVLACFWQVGQLIRSVSWIERFAAGRSGDATETAPQILAPLAALLGQRHAGAAISDAAARGMQDSVAARIEEARDITRYLANLLIFLGLLGTFYGLATTVPAVVETIRSLAPQPGESAIELFEKLMSGLEGQLGGMATAFSSSLLGLAGSLVVGLLELFATHGQNRFYRELEEWMTSFTQLVPAEGGGDVPLAAFADRLAGQLQSLTAFYAERDQLNEVDLRAADERALLMARTVAAMAEDAREAAAARQREGEAMHDLLLQLVAAVRAADIGPLIAGQARLNTLAETAAGAVPPLARNLDALAAGHVQLMAATQALAEGQARLADDRGGAALHALGTRLTEGQERLIALAEISAEDRAAINTEASATLDEMRARLRSLNQQLTRLAEVSAEDRLTMQAELRADIATLTRAVRRLGGQTQPDAAGDG